MNNHYKIALDFRMLEHTGFYTYANELYQHIEQLTGNPTAQSVLKFYDPESMQNLPHSALALARNLYEMTAMSNKLTELNVDLFHCTRNYGVPLSKKIAIVTTLHDIIPLVLARDYANSLFMRAYYSYNISRTIKYSKKIITISNFSRDEIIKYFPKVKNKIEVIYSAHNLNSQNITSEQKKAVLHKYQLTKPFILTMGGAEPRKNVAGLCKLFMKNNFDFDLVVIGNNWRNLSLDEYAKSENIHILTKLNTEELTCLYSQAEFFIFPSLYEGFGLPVLEAMSCACPVIAHNFSSIPEICGKAAYLVDMTKPLTLVQAIKYFQDNPNFKKELRVQALEQAKKFTWQKTAEATQEIYQEALG